MKALISVYDKTGVVEFARVLQGKGFELVSTGGTHKTLADAGLTVQQVSDLTGSPEILDGRVKTLHPTVHGGILAQRDLQAHTEQLTEQGIDTIDVVVGNLYPFVETISRAGVTLEDALENVDIGGPTMISMTALAWKSPTSSAYSTTSLDWQTALDYSLTLPPRWRRIPVCH